MDDFHTLFEVKAKYCILRGGIVNAERDALEERNRVQGFDEHRSAVVPWLRETGIVDHVRGLKKDEIRAAITIPSPEENSDLRRIVDATELMLREAHSCRFQSSQVESFGKIRPFDPYKEPNTFKTYFKLAQRALVYFDRVAAGHEYCFSAESEDSVRPEDHVEPTEKQVEVWHAACLLAKHEIPAGDEERQSQLKSRFVEFWMLLVCQDTGSRRYRSPLLSFCAMLSIKPSTQSWLELGNFNSNLSAIMWVVQLLLFYDSARKERGGQGKTLDHVKHYCENFLQQTVETPMGEILRWRLLLFRVSKDSVGETTKRFGMRASRCQRTKTRSYGFGSYRLGSLSSSFLASSNFSNNPSIHVLACSMALTADAWLGSGII
ncbi:hypothetical protein LTR95_008124 [Oleoguttula sp. CCFEE 5521]